MKPQLDIIEAVLSACPVQRGAFYGEGRVPDVVKARWVAMRLMRDEGYTLTSIARVFGHDHTNVSHGLQRLPATDPSLKQARDILAGRQALTIHAPSTHSQPARQMPCAGDVW